MALPSRHAGAIPGATSPWLRPIAIAAVTAIHVGALTFVTMPKPDLPSPVESIELSLAPPQGDLNPETQDAAPDSMAQMEVPPDTRPPDPTPDPEPPPPDLTEPPPPDTPPPVEETPPVVAPTPVEPPPPVAAEPPKVEAPDAVVVPPAPKPPPPKPRVVKRVEKPKPEIKKIAKPRPPAPSSAASAPAGVKTEQVGAAARASYSAKVNAAIRAHFSTPPATGATVVSFVVGSSGGMTSASVASSSGNGALDAFALRVVRAAHPGPPPGGGGFFGQITIRGN
jgi:periplasmic protein TonB